MIPQLLELRRAASIVFFRAIIYLRVGACGWMSCSSKPRGLKLILQRSSAQVIKTMLQRAYHTRDE